MESNKFYHQTTKAPSLSVSLLSQGNNGSFSKPFANKHGLYAAVLLNELIYLQDLFLHKRGIGVMANENGHIFLGFYRSYQDLNMATQIPMDTLKRKKVNNPIQILKKLGILMTSSTITPEFKKIIVYKINEYEAEEAIKEATFEYYQKIEERRKDKLYNNSILTVSKYDDAEPVMEMVKGQFSEIEEDTHQRKCAKRTNVENKGLNDQNQSEIKTGENINIDSEKDRLGVKSSQNTSKQLNVTTKTSQNTSKNTENTSSALYPQENAQNALSKVSKTHTSNKYTNPTTQGNNTNLDTSAPEVTNPKGETRIAERSERNKKVETTSDIERQWIDAVYEKDKGLYGQKVRDSLLNYFLNNTDEQTTHTELVKYTKLPSGFKMSREDEKLLKKLKNLDDSLMYISPYVDKIIRNSAFIQCKKRRQAFGQLFVGIDLDRDM